MTIDAHANFALTTLATADAARALVRRLVEDRVVACGTVVPGSTSQTSVCRVRVSRKLTAEEIAALPASHRP